MVANALPAAKQQPKSSLGTDRKIRVHIPAIPPAPDGETPSEYRFRLQKWARSCYGNHDDRLMGCCIRPVPGAHGVQVVRNPETGTAHFVGLEQCNRVWICPVCAQRITNERRKELSYALAAAKQKGFTAVLVTYTMSHQYSDLLEASIGGLQAAVRDFKAGRGWQDIKAEYGVVGGIKALEVTFGENGWHPHVHELMFLDIDPAKVNVEAFRKWLVDRWLAMLEKHGKSASIERGLDVRTADSDIADYIAKWGHQPKELAWGAEHEIANAPNKKAHRDGLTPFQLLEAVSGGDARARVLFQEYAHVMSGKRQLVWSAGLRALLEMPDELPDEQLPLFDVTEKAYIAVDIPADEWRRCCIYELQPRILGLVAAGALIHLQELFRRRDIEAVFLEAPNIEKAQTDELPGRPNFYAETTLIPVQATLPGMNTAVRYE